MQPGRRTFLKAAAAAGIAAAAPPTRAVSQRVDVVVLGAGLAGLAAAGRLDDAGLDTLVIEARQRPGGRVHTAFDLPDRPEFGAVEVGNSYTRVLDLGRRHGLRVAPADRRWFRATALHVNGRTVDGGDWAASPANLLADGEKAIPPQRIEHHYLAKANPLETVEGWDGASQRPHDRSIGDVLRGLGASPEALRLADVAGSHNGIDAASALPAWRQALAIRQETGTGRFVDGAGALPRAMAAALGGRVRYGSAVVALRAARRGVEVALADGTHMRARHCICTLPVPALRALRLDLPVAAAQRRAIEGVRYTRVSIALFDAEPFWEDDGLPPYMWTDTPLERLFPRIAADGSACIGFKAFINGRATMALDRLPEREFADTALAIWKRIRPASEGRVRYVRRHKWADDPFAGGAYAVWSPGEVAAQRAALRLPAGPVRFAGVHTALDAPGMEGAVRSGERAADEIITGEQT